LYSLNTDQTRVAIIILTMNQCAKTLRCLDSLSKIQQPSNQIILWDNGSTDGTLNAVKEKYNTVFIHYHPINVGVASGRNMASNLAIQNFNPEFLFFMDNDMTVTPLCLANLVSPFSTQEKLAQTTGKILDMDHPNRIYGAGGNRIRFWLGETRHVGYGKIDQGQYDVTIRCIPSGGCMMVRTHIFQKLGGFDSIFDPYGPEDLDFGLKVVKAGFYGLYIPEAVVYHETRPGRTFEGGKYTEKFASLRVKHWFNFMNRHATPLQKLLFYVVGIPYLIFSFIFRQSQQGNLIPAMRSLMRGTMRFLINSKKTQP
jgi:GT2 family glycosyltransferase